jgi:hypothetical protein
VLEAEQVREIALPRVRASQLAEAVHAELPELSGGGVAKRFHVGESDKGRRNVCG